MVLFLHGNAGTVADRIPIAEGLVGEGLPVLLLEYRGYGRSQGRPSEEGLHEDALAGWGFLLELGWASRRQVVFGRSMGAAVAARLVAECPSGGLILESAFTSLRDMARLLYPFLPGFFSSRLEGRFDTRRQTESVRAPLLVIHGEEDDLVPVTMGRSVYEAGKGPKVWMPVPGAGHNDVYWVGGEEYFRRIRDFALTSVSGGNGAGGAPV